MNPLLQVFGQALGKYHVGHAVRIEHGFRGMIGEVVEDHGPIGVRGRRFYSVKLRLDPWNEHISELPEESLEAVDGTIKGEAKTSNGRVEGGSQ